MKVMERIFEKRLRKQVEIDEMRMRFMPGEGIINALFFIRQMIEKYEVAGRQLICRFVKNIRSSA